MTVREGYIYSVYVCVVRGERGEKKIEKNIRGERGKEILQGLCSHIALKLLYVYIFTKDR